MSETTLMRKWIAMTEPKEQAVYYVLTCVTTYRSLQEAKAKAFDAIAAHLARSREWHNRGILLMAGAFLDRPEEPLSTMAVLTTKEAAEEYARGDPFVINGMVSEWYVREWANILV
jgi:uncharacterized protein YciI